MNPDIEIVRDGDAYRLLHGYLRLTSLLQASDEVSVHVKGEGNVRVRWTGAGYLIGKDGLQLPLRDH